jgi:transcriptional regulator with XRE-family HTH domain
MTDSQQRWALIRDVVRERMRDLAISQAELVRASGVSDFTVRKVMNGTPGNYRESNLAKMALALGWTPTAFADLLAGRRPTVRPRIVDVHDFSDLDLPADVRTALEVLVGDLGRTNKRVDQLETKLLRRLAQFEEALGLDEDDFQPSSTLEQLDELIDKLEGSVSPDPATAEQLEPGDRSAGQ